MKCSWSDDCCIVARALDPKALGAGEVSKSVELVRS